MAEIELEDESTQEDEQSLSSSSQDAAYERIPDAQLAAVANLRPPRGYRPPQQRQPVPPQQAQPAQAPDNEERVLVMTMLETLGFERRCIAQAVRLYEVET